MMRNATRAAVLLASAWLLGACAGLDAVKSPPLQTRERRVKLDVPFYPDKTDQCGPSALASVLHYWGIRGEPDELRRDIYQARLGGSLPVDLLLAAESRGMSAEILDGSLPRLRRELDDGHPLIAFLDVGAPFMPVGHFLVITGYDDRLGGVYAHSGGDRDRFVTYAHLFRHWDKTQRWTLLVLPSAQ